MGKIKPIEVKDCCLHQGYSNCVEDEFRKLEKLVNEIEDSMESIENLLVCAPIADLSELVDSAYLMVKRARHKITDYNGEIKEPTP